MFHVEVGLVVAMTVAVVGPVGAETIEEAACYVFGGREDCRTVKVIDANECIIKVHPQPLPELNPEIAACLLDEAQTRLVYLRKATPRKLFVSDRIEIKGRDAVEVLLRYDDNGAPVWQPRNSDSFELKGDKARTQATIEQFSSEYCPGESRMVGGGTSGGTIGVKEAFERAAEGSIVLVDIRLPSEWRRTGVAVNATTITMHQSIDKFVDQLKKVTGSKKTPIALICAEGVRTAAMQQRLKKYGFQGVIDVREGMVGGRHGPGWIKSGLPITPYKP